MDSCLVRNTSKDTEKNPTAEFDPCVRILGDSSPRYLLSLYTRSKMRMVCAPIHLATGWEGLWVNVLVLQRSWKLHFTIKPCDVLKVWVLGKEMVQEMCQRLPKNALSWPCVCTQSEMGHGHVYSKKVFLDFHHSVHFMGNFSLKELV